MSLITQPAFRSLHQRKDSAKPIQSILFFLKIGGALRRRGSLALFIAAFAPLSLLAQSVRWDPPAGQLGFNQVSQISLVFEDCEPDGAPALPQVDGLVFGRPSQSSQTSIVNFTMTRTFSLVYPVRPTKRANVGIPAFEVKTDKGALRVAAASYTVGDATVGNSGVPLEDIASAKLTVAKQSFWAGEVFPVVYNLNVARRYFHSLATNIEWPSAPFAAEEWSKPEPGEALVGGERRVVSVQSTRAYSKQAGNLTLNPASQMVNLMVGTTGFGLFSQPTVEQRQVDTEPVSVTIKPLPPAPTDFSGAVGEFSFKSKVVPTTTAVGEPVTWTIDLSGTGNWPDITGLPSRDVSNDFQVVQPKSKRTMKEGSLFEGTLTEDVVLVPTKPGTYRLTPVHFTFFDTKTGSYKTLASEPATITVTATTQPVQPPANSGAPMQFSINAPPATSSTPPALPTAVPPVAPENLPRDPLAKPAQGFVPFKADTFWLVVAIPAVALVLLVWLILAVIRSRENDPQRLRRAARAKLESVLAGLTANASPSARNTQLRLWQQQAAVLWEIPHAAPGAPLLNATVTAHDKEAGATWTTLWNEADRTLHSREPVLPKDWPSRAQAAVHAVRVPGWPLFSVLAPRNLFPFFTKSEEMKATGLNNLFRAGIWIVVFFGLVSASPSVFGADAAIEAYKSGDFSSAEKNWQTAVAAVPGDWSARHNLGDALAQQDRWAEAAAHWTSAFLLNARAAITRYDLALGLKRSGMAPPELVELSRGEGRFKLARLASPGEWQLALVAAALLFAVALVVLLLQGYRRAGAWAKPMAFVTSLLAVLLAASATLSLHVYGPLADPDVALVWKSSVLRSIPTEADTTQKTSPLSAGSIAVAEKTFLGWTKLHFSGGQSGWVRTEDLIKLYQ